MILRKSLNSLVVVRLGGPQNNLVKLDAGEGARI